MSNNIPGASFDIKLSQITSQEQVEKMRAIADGDFRYISPLPFAISGPWIIINGDVVKIADLFHVE